MMIKSKLVNLSKIYKIVSNYRHLHFFSNIKNPYQVLGVSRNATIQQIKKSFRTIAQKYHPDKNPDSKAQTIFVQAKQAYQILTDEDKRKQYDNQHSGSTQTGRGYGFDKNPFDEFNDQVYKDKSRTYHQSYTKGSSRKRKGEDVIKEVKISFSDSIKGTSFNIEYEKKATCPSCHGNKCKPGSAPTRCLACGGSGSTIYRQGSIVMHLECARCNGIGLIIKNPCTQCKATGVLNQVVKDQVKIPAGVENGQTMTLRQKGNQSDNGPSGDLIIKFIVQKHPKFRKQGDNIATTQWLTISQAALGCKKKIETIWGQKQITISAGTQDGSKMNINGYGIEAMLTKGDHIVNFRIKIPTKLTQSQRRIFAELARQQEPIKQQDTKNRQTKDNQENFDQKEGVFGKFKNIFK